MQDSIAFESYPTHPLGKHESWPVTGPVYGFAEAEDVRPSKSFWQRIVNVAAVEQMARPQPAASPVWY